MKDTLSPAAICLSHIEQDAYRSRVIAFHRQCIYSVIFPDVLVYPQGDVHAADKTGIYFFAHSMDWFWGRLFVIGLYMKE